MGVATYFTYMYNILRTILGHGFTTQKNVIKITRSGIIINKHLISKVIHIYPISLNEQIDDFDE